MSKLKTNKAASKRFRFTSTGKVKFEKTFASHNLTKKSMKRKRRLRKNVLVNKSDLKEVRLLLPYGGK